MCCHLNRFAPLRRCINSVISISEVTKGWQGSLYLLWIHGFAVTAPAGDGAGCRRAKRCDLKCERTAMRWAEPGVCLSRGSRSSRIHPNPPPTPTNLNPIPCYRFGKSIWSKTRAQREMQYIPRPQMEADSEQLNKYTHGLQHEKSSFH